MAPASKKERKARHGGNNCPFWIDRHVKEQVHVSTLKEAVDEYIKNYQKHLQNVLALYKNMKFADVVEFAGRLECPVCESVYPHQYHISHDTREDFSKALQKVMASLQNAKSFEDLWKIIKPLGEQTKGIGNLTAYDAALRIGFQMGIPPKDYVYAFNGATIGEGQRGQHVFPLNTFKTELTTRLTAYEIEDFLCVFHDERGKKEFTVLK